MQRVVKEWGWWLLLLSLFFFVCLFVSYMTVQRIGTQINNIATPFFTAVYLISQQHLLSEMRKNSCHHRCLVRHWNRWTAANTEQGGLISFANPLP